MCSRLIAEVNDFIREDQQLMYVIIEAFVFFNRQPTIWVLPA